MDAQTIAIKILTGTAEVMEDTHTMRETYAAVREVSGPIGLGLREDFVETIANVFGVEPGVAFDVYHYMRVLCENLADPEEWATATTA